MQCCWITKESPCIWESLSKGWVSWIRVGRLAAVLIRCGCHNKALQTGWFKTIEIHSLILEAGTLKFQYWVGHAFSPSFGWLLAVLGIPWLATAELQSLPVFPLCVFLWCSFCVCLFLCLFCSYENTSHSELRNNPTAVWPYFNIDLNYIWKDPVSK